MLPTIIQIQKSNKRWPLWQSLRALTFTALATLAGCFSTEQQLESNQSQKPSTTQVENESPSVDVPSDTETESVADAPEQIEPTAQTETDQQENVDQIISDDSATHSNTVAQTLNNENESSIIEDMDNTISSDQDQPQNPIEEPQNSPLNVSVNILCEEIGKKLGSVSIGDCLNVGLVDSGGRSRENRAIVLKNFESVPDQTSLGKVLLMGGIHGDEYSSVSIVFKWLATLDQHHSGLFEWTVVPLLNPDGLLMTQSQRQNSAGVDLNRNFPTPDWSSDAHDYWRNRTYENPRRYPGPEAASEPETRWFMEQIELIKPDAIVAVHAPHRLVDYDGPQKPPHKLGKLYFRELGIYPGSLGNYAGVSKNIPVVTIELASAGIMPSDSEISAMWTDLVQWLKTEVPKQRLARSEDSR